MKGSETMSTSMTKGNPLKLMLQFALPLLIGNLLQQTYNIIDAAIVGQILGAKALASVGASSSVQFLVLGFCMGCCTGFGVPVAKYFGADKMDTMRNYVFNGAVLTGGIGVTVTVLCSVFCPQILHLLSVPEDIFRGAYHYLPEMKDRKEAIERLFDIELEYTFSTSEQAWAALVLALEIQDIPKFFKKSTRNLSTSPIIMFHASGISFFCLYLKSISL